jgi:hypothetical protein
MFMEDDFVMPPKLELKSLKIRADLFHIIVLSDNAEEQNEDRILGINSCKFMIPAFIDEDQIVAKAFCCSWVVEMIHESQALYPANWFKGT